jgi:hypothetical protein
MQIQVRRQVLCQHFNCLRVLRAKLSYVFDRGAEPKGWVVSNLRIYRPEFADDTHVYFIRTQSNQGSGRLRKPRDRRDELRGRLPAALAN